MCTRYEHMAVKPRSTSIYIYIYINHKQLNFKTNRKTKRGNAENMKWICVKLKIKS